MTKESGGLHEGLLEEETPVWILERPLFLLLEHKERNGRKSTVDSTEKKAAGSRGQATLNAIIGCGVWGV